MPNAKTGRVYKRRHGFKATRTAGCRCKPCRRAYKKTTLDNARQIEEQGGAGRWDGDVVREHIRMLAEVKKMGSSELQRVADLPNTTIVRIMKGKPRDGLGPPVTIKKSLGDKIMAVTGNEERVRWHAYVDPQLTIKRLRSLAALGYTAIEIERLVTGRDVEKSGCDPYRKMLLHPERVDKITVQTAEQIRDVYQKIGDTRAPEPDNVTLRGHRTRMRHLVEKEGWDVPASWDDPGTLAHDLEPSAAPMPEGCDPVVVERIVQGNTRSLSPNHIERREAFRQMQMRGIPNNEIRRRLRVSSQTFNKILKEL